MACSKPSYDELQENSLTTCSICLEEMENPKALPCLHSFCLKCLKKVAHPPGSFICPLCQEKIPLPPAGVDGFRDNFFFNQMKERKAIFTTGQFIMPCPSCGATDRQVAARCMDCNGFLCQQCVHLHDTIVPLKVHTVFTLDELRLGAGDMMIEHTRPEHDYVTIESATEGQLAEIKKLVTNCKGLSHQIDEAITKTQQVKDHFQKAADEAKKQLDNAKDEAQKVFLKALKENHTANTNKLAEIQTKRSEKIDNDIKSLQNLQSRLTNAMDVANQVIQTGSKHDVASNYSTLCKNLTQLQESEVRPTVISKGFGVVKFKPSQKSRVESVNLGTVLSSRGRKWVLEKQIGMEGSGKIKGGLGVAVDPNTVDIFIADFSDKNIKVFDSNGNYKRVLQGNLKIPHDVAVSSNGLHFVTDCTAHVKVFSADGKYLQQFSAISPYGISSDRGGSQLYGLTIDSDGNLLVGSDNKHDKYISKHKQDGTHISTIETNICPWHLGITTQWRIVVCADNTDTNVEIMDHTGNLLHTINKPKDAKSWRPCGACCSNDGIIYVSSSNAGDHGGIYSFTEDGEYLGCVTNDVIHAEGIAMIDDDRLVVAQYGYPAKIFSYVY
ncbi:uncharacterized protein [Amphiura filiformis]|uniref:uncharacterized protein n=1 Tax=Amphiura filiformis TaxID=82378 RepID=UPI003B20BAAA